MRGIPVLLGVFDVPKCEAIESSQSRDLGVHHRDGDKDDPSDTPDREEHESHHSEEANEEISI